jgi:hypothetical protein
LVGDGGCFFDGAAGRRRKERKERKVDGER